MKKKSILYSLILIAALTVTTIIYIQSKSALNLNTLSLTDLNGKPVNINQFTGSPLLINFWATWCGECLSEKPQLADAQKQLANNDFKFIMISDEPIEKIKSYTDKHPYPFIFLHATQSLKWYKIFSIPTTFLINKQQKIVFSHQGSLPWNHTLYLNMLKEISN